MRPYAERYPGVAWVAPAFISDGEPAFAEIIGRVVDVIVVPDDGDVSSAW